MPPRREEVLRRLGSHRFRFVCPLCRSYVSELHRGAIWDDGLPDGHRKVMACSGCIPRLGERNLEYTRRRAREQVQLEIANREYRESFERSSSPEYLEACERMRREGW